MFKAFRRISVSSLAYASLLMAFVSLGAFVAALATESRWTTISGVALVACLAASVAGFRAAGRAVARTTAVAEPASAVSIFSTPLQQEQVDRYLETYRGGRGAPRTERRMAVLVDGKTTKHAVRPAILRRQPTSAAERESLSA
ncbi:MAG: hypothetical protein QOJ24_3001 [Mycobacterium sp.]|jgi:hypothetical protein|nr:hypothetical protein [Mycobacterium sp.]